MRFLKVNEKKIVIILLSILLLQSLLSIPVTSPTYDESHHSTASHYYLRTGNYTFDVEHPPLKTIAALPLLFYNFSTPKCFLCTDIYGDKYESALFFPRIIILIFSLILGFFVYLWAKRLFSVEAGLMALFFYVFDPNILAHSRLFTTDIIGASLIFISAFYFWAFLKDASWRNAFFVGITFGLALIAKFTAILLVPAYLIFLVIFLICNSIRLDRRSAKLVIEKLFIILAASLLIVNSAYLFVGTFTRFGDYNFGSSMKGLQNTFTNLVPLPLPKYFVEGLDVAKTHSETDHFGWYAFLMGEHQIKGWWYYFIIAFLIKTPISTLLLFLLFISLFFLCRFYRNPDYYFLLVPVALFMFIFSFFTHVNIGLRYILPVYPFIFVAIGSLYNFFVKNRFGSDVLILLLMFYLISAISIFPHHLAYFNELIGGPKNGYNYLIDSNLEWGQNDRLVDEYVKATGAIKNPGCNPVTGIIVVDANNLHGIFDRSHIMCYKWLRNNYNPIDYIGYSWLVYNTTI